jgi:hypothetical protein
MKGMAFSFVLVGVAVALGIAQSQSRRVEMELTLPNGAHPTVVVHEGDTASIQLPNAGKFGFVPTVKPGDSETLIVDVLDLNQTPPRNVDSVETSLRGAAVPTNTKPQIAIRATYIETK